MADITSILSWFYSMTIEQIGNDELAAINNAVQLWGKISPKSKGFDIATKLQIVNESGIPADLEALQRALAYEVNRRVDAGEFD